MLAHRPGFLFPTQAAKVFSTIDQIGQRPARHPHHLRRQRRRAAPRGRLPRQVRALRPLRRVHPDPAQDLGRRRRRSATRATYYRFEDFQTDVRPYQDTDPDLGRRLVAGRLPGRRPAGRHLRPVGRAARRRPASRSPRSTPSPTPPGGRGRASGCRSGRSSPPPTSWPGRRPATRWPRCSATSAGGAMGSRRPLPGQGTPGQRRLAAPARAGRARRAARPRAVDAAGHRDQRRRQLDRAGRQLRDRRPGAARLRRHRLRAALDPRLRPAQRRHRLRPLRAAPRSARSSRDRSSTVSV